MILCDFVVYPVFWFQIVKLLLVFCLILASCAVSFFHHVKRSPVDNTYKMSPITQLTKDAYSTGQRDDLPTPSHHGERFPPFTGT